MSHDPKEPWTPEMKADEAVDRESCIAAVDHALAAGWRPKDIVGLLRGTQRYANGFIVAVCERCRRPEYEDGLILTEVIEAGDDLNPPILGGGVCPICRAKEVKR